MDKSKNKTNDALTEFYAKLEKIPICNLEYTKAQKIKGEIKEIANTLYRRIGNDAFNTIIQQLEKNNVITLRMVEKRFKLVKKYLDNIQNNKSNIQNKDIIEGISGLMELGVNNLIVNMIGNEKIDSEPFKALKDYLNHAPKTTLLGKHNKNKVDEIKMQIEKIAKDLENKINNEKNFDEFVKKVTNEGLSLQTIAGKFNYIYNNINNITSQQEINSQKIFEFSILVIDIGKIPLRGFQTPETTYETTTYLPITYE